MKCAVAHEAGLRSFGLEGQTSLGRDEIRLNSLGREIVKVFFLCAMQAN